MRKTLIIALVVTMLLSLVGCGNSQTQNSAQETNETEAETTLESSGDTAETTAVQEAASSTETTSPASSDTSADSEAPDSGDTTADPGGGSNMLVAVFSLAGEQYSVGVIEEGNTAIIADMIVEQTGADLFRIENVNPYPDTYDGLLEISREEEAADTRPEIAGTVENMDDYDVIFLGYPIWWGDMPMIVYGFLESYDFSGKTIVPFCTHGGSGLSGTVQSIAEACPGATVADGLAISGATAQNERDEARETVTQWLTEAGYI